MFLVANERITETKNINWIFKIIMNVGVSVTLNQKCTKSKSGLKVARTLLHRTGRIQTNGDELIYQKT